MSTGFPQFQEELVTSTFIYRVFYSWLTDKAPAQRSARRSVNVVFYTAPLGTSAVDDGSYTNDVSDNNI
jgi:hypothetical protein